MWTSTRSWSGRRRRRVSGGPQARERARDVSDHALAIVLDLPAAVAVDREAAAAEREVHEAVAIELGGGVVIAVAVGLDHQPVCAPKKVGPPTMKLHVHLGDLEPTRLAKRDEDSLSPAPRVRQARLMALERLAEGPGATLSVTKHAFDRLDVEDVEVFGLRERLSRLVQPGVCREVNQRLGDGGNRETAVAGGVEVTGVVDENFGQRARPTEGADFDPPWLVVNKPPPPRCGAVAQNRVRPGVQQRCYELALDRDRWVAKGIYARVPIVKLPARSPAGDPPRTQPTAAQLASSDDAPLLASYPGRAN